MKTKQRTYDGSSAYRYCQEFMDSMDVIYNVKKAIFEKLKDKDAPWVKKWRVIVYYESV